MASDLPAWLSPKARRPSLKAIARLGGIARMASLSRLERRLFQSRAGRISGKKAAASKTPEQRAAFARLGGLARARNMTAAERSDAMKHARKVV